jgi:ribulose-5-phosphate 4-epimerase/fuculose-1-phosphate aldolase
MQGWMGKTLEVDLSSREIAFHQLDVNLARLFLGGRGLGARLLWERVRPEVERLPAALQEYKIAMVRGHGCFSMGQTLDEAFQWVSCLEESCQIILAAKTIDEPFLEYRKMSEDYKSW